MENKQEKMNKFKDLLDHLLYESKFNEDLYSCKEIEEQYEVIRNAEQELIDYVDSLIGE